MSNCCRMAPTRRRLAVSNSRAGSGGQNSTTPLYPVSSTLRSRRPSMRIDPVPKPLQADLRLCSEDTVETLLTRHNMLVVNFALNEQSVPTHFGKGSRCGVQIKPKWSCIYANSNRCIPMSALFGETRKFLPSGGSNGDIRTIRATSRNGPRLWAKSPSTKLPAVSVTAIPSATRSSLSSGSPACKSTTAWQAIVGGGTLPQPASYASPDIPDISVLSVDNPGRRHRLPGRKPDRLAVL